VRRAGEASHPARFGCEVEGLGRAWCYVTLNRPLLVAVPARVVTETWPVVAPAGTVATIVVAVSETIVAAVLLKATRMAPERLCPVPAFELLRRGSGRRSARAFARRHRCVARP
jgi:hypothetical protein